MDCTDAGGPGEFFLIARRNNSLSSAGRAVVLGSLVVVCLAISLAFAFNGAWLVLPFAGAEMAVLFFAFRYVGRHAGEYESVEIQGDRMVVKRRETGKVTRYEFNRHWAQVIVHREGVAGRVSLALRSHGKEVGFGTHLTEEQREAAVRTLTQQLRTVDTYKDQVRTTMIVRFAQILASLSLLPLGGGSAWAQAKYNLQPPQTIIAHQIYDLHTIILIICAIIFIVVFGVMFYAIWKHRKSVGHEAEQFHENAAVEIIWTIVPFLILIGMAYPATRTILGM